MQASLADMDDDAVDEVVHLDTRVTSCANIVDPPAVRRPPLRQALALTTISSCNFKSPLLISLKTSSIVMSLARLAGGDGTSALFS